MGAALDGAVDVGPDDGSADGASPVGEAPDGGEVDAAAEGDVDPLGPPVPDGADESEPGDGVTPPGPVGLGEGLALVDVPG